MTASAEGVPPLTVKVGLDNAFDSSAYLQRGTDPKVYSVDGTTRASLDKSTFDLRDKEVLSVRDLGLTRIELTSKKHRFVLARDPGQPFAFVRPAPEAADGSAVSGWIAALKSRPRHPLSRRHPRRAAAHRGGEAGRRGGLPARVDRDGAGAAGRGEEGHRPGLRPARGRLRDLAERGSADGTGRPGQEPGRAPRPHGAPRRPAGGERASASSRGDGGAALVVERDRPSDGGPETWRLTAPVQGAADPFKARELALHPHLAAGGGDRGEAPHRGGEDRARSRARAPWCWRARTASAGLAHPGQASSKPAGTFARDDRGGWWWWRPAGSRSSRRVLPTCCLRRSARAS